MNRIVLAALLLTASSFGQAGLATVTGTISDATGAVLANAPVEVRNRDNGQVFRGASSDTGNYTVSQLPIGDYDLSITVTGFKTYSHTNFHLAAAQIMREDVALEVGQTTESVTVTAEASLLKTESSQVVQNVTLSQLNNLPVLVVGATASGVRDPFASARLVPGVQYTNGQPGATAVVAQMVVNGTPSNTYQTRLDGMTTNPTGPRNLGAQQQTQPSVDAIEEVAIQTSNFAAEYGTAGGAMINMVTKSGTNTYHGSGYDYVVNEVLNAHQPYLGTRNKIRQHDFGFTVGGPLRIPKLYDGKNKTFFFYSYEKFKQTNVVVSSVSVPTASYRGGDFSKLLTAENRLVTTAAGAATDALGRTIASGTIFDPNTTQVNPANGRSYRDPFPGNQIPLARYDSIASKVLALVPLPQGPNFERGLATGNYTGTFDSSRQTRIPSVKVDQNIGSKGRLSFYFQYTQTTTPRTAAGADPLPDLITAGVLAMADGYTSRLNYDHNISPRMLLHVGVGWNDAILYLEAPVNNYDSLKELGLTGQTMARYFPRIVSGVNANDNIGGMSPLGTTFPTKSYERRPAGNATLSYVTGGHTYKFGIDYRLEKYPNYVLTNTNGTYTFGTNMTETPSLLNSVTNQGFHGFPLASFLLGGMSANSQAAPIALSNIKSQTALFAQDTWKITRTLTLDYGVRWDYGTYSYEQYGRNGSTGLAVPNPSAGGRLGATQFEATCKCQFASNYPFAIGPRVGVGYQLNSKTVLRGAFGVVYNSTSTAVGFTSNSASSNAFPANSGLTTGLFKDGMPASVHAVWPSFDANVGQGVGTVVAMPSLLDQNAGRPARLLQFNFGVQREINRDFVVEANYVANRGAWWTANTLGTLNALSQNRLQSLGFNDFTNPTEAALLTGLVSGLTTAQRSTLAARGITGLPYSNFPGNQTVRQSLVDYPQYTGSGLAGAPLGNTWYDSLQVTGTKRFSHGVSFNMNYTWSKNLDTLSFVSDVFNRGLSKNVSVNDRPHALRFTVQYQVPDLKKSGVAFVSNKYTSAVLSGWGIGAFMSYQSAPLLTRPTSNGALPISQFLGRGPGGAQLKRNADGSYMSPWSVNWVDNDGKQRTDPIDINCHCFDPTKNQALNPLAWENIPNGQWGADQSTMRFFRGTRLPDENANLSRNFRIKERVSLNVRVEFNNVFNRMRLPNPTTVAAAGASAINFASAPTKFTTGPSTGLYSGGFGTYSVLGGLLGQRNGTIVARVTF
jgi:hypothetical protein